MSMESMKSKMMPTKRKTILTMNSFAIATGKSIAHSISPGIVKKFSAFPVMAMSMLQINATKHPFIGLNIIR